LLINIDLFTVQVNITGDQTMGTVADLKPFTEYSCTIHAVTVAGGPMSDPVLTRTAEGGIVVTYNLMDRYSKP